MEYGRPKCATKFIQGPTPRRVQPGATVHSEASLTLSPSRAPRRVRRDADAPVRHDRDAIVHVLDRPAVARFLAPVLNGRLHVACVNVALALAPLEMLRADDVDGAGGGLA